MINKYQFNNGKLNTTVRYIDPMLKGWATEHEEEHIYTSDDNKTFVHFKEHKEDTFFAELTIDSPNFKWSSSDNGVDIHNGELNKGYWWLQNNFESRLNPDMYGSEAIGFKGKELEVSMSKLKSKMKYVYAEYTLNWVTQGGYDVFEFNHNGSNYRWEFGGIFSGNSMFDCGTFNLMWKDCDPTKAKSIGQSSEMAISFDEYSQVLKELELW